MTDILTISLDDGRGKMTLYLPNFFPCRVTDIRNFYKKCVQSDLSNNDQAEVMCGLANYLTNRIMETEDCKEKAKLQKNFDTVMKYI